MLNLTQEPDNDTCGICNKTVGKKQRHITCHLCNQKIHIKCNEIDAKSYEKIKQDETAIFCIKCYKEITPFYTSYSNDNESNKCTSPFLRNIINLVQDSKSNDEITDTNIPPICCADIDIDIN